MSSGSLFYSLFTSFRFFDDYLPILHYRLDMEFYCSTFLAHLRLAATFSPSGNEADPLYFAAALVVFLLAFISPFSALANGYLFSAHMVQHILLVLIVPALLLLSLPRSFSLRPPLTYLSSSTDRMGCRSRCDVAVARADTL